MERGERSNEGLFESEEALDREESGRLDSWWNIPLFLDHWSNYKRKKNDSTCHEQKMHKLDNL